MIYDDGSQVAALPDDSEVIKRERFLHRAYDVFKNLYVTENSLIVNNSSIPNFVFIERAISFD